jgi:hypothetical protein
MHAKNRDHTGVKIPLFPEKNMPEFKASARKRPPPPKPAEPATPKKQKVVDDDDDWRAQPVSIVAIIIRHHHHHHQQVNIKSLVREVLLSKEFLSNTKQSSFQRPAPESAKSVFEQNTILQVAMLTENRKIKTQLHLEKVALLEQQIEEEVRLLCCSLYLFA